MAKARHTARDLALRLAVAALALVVLTRERQTGRTKIADLDEVPNVRETSESSPLRLGSQRGAITLRRLATLTAFAALFVGGAAFSAGAGDVVADVVEDSTSAADTTTGETTTEPAPQTPAPPSPEEAPAVTEPASPGESTTQPSPAESAPAPQAPVETETPGSAEEPAQQPGGPAPGQAEPVPNGELAPAAASAAGSSSVTAGGSKQPKAVRAPELEGPAAYATIWLHRVLPDPTPPAKRLTPAFAETLRASARASGVGWDLVLAVLRARGRDGSVPAGPARLAQLAGRLSAAGGGHDRRRAALAVGGGSELFADRVMALSSYNRAVGLRALVTGLEAAKGALAARVLADDRVHVYGGGRLDILSGRLDVRVLVLIRYLRVTFGSVTVSSLRSGHRFFARPGVPSAHVYGLAVDVSALGDVSVTGNQDRGGIVERAVEAILLLPSELQPQQVISLLGFGGRSFAQADHYDHIHVGY